jgi:hypothetical protein
MKMIRSLIVLAALAIGMAAPASAQGGVGGSAPEFILYRFPGVVDNGGTTNAGVATSFHCTNFSGVSENVRVAVRSEIGTLVANAELPVPHLQTRTWSTHGTSLYFDDVILATGKLTQGTAAIAATSINVICTAVTLDAASPIPNGFALRGIRFNPAPGSQE